MVCNGALTVATVLAVNAPMVVAEVLLSGVLGVGIGLAMMSSRNRTRQRRDGDAIAALRREVVTTTDEVRQRTDDLAAVGLAADSLPLGVLVVDADGREILRNDAVDVVLGPPAGSMDQRSDPRSDGEVMAGGTLRRLVERAADGHRGRETLDIVGPPRRNYIVTAEPIDASATARAAVVATVQDVSEQRRTDAMRQDFISNVSHELRTPVGAVAILAETLATETDPSAIVRLSGRLEREAHRLSSMIDDLLALGNVESAASSGEEFVSVQEIVDEAVERARTSAEKRGIEVAVVDVTRGLSVRGERRQLVTALHNLVENALKYSDKGAPVEVRAGVDYSSPGRIAIAVVDQGIGIPTRDQERIFERFYRVDRARARDTGGSGLGLAIVRHVVRNHDGDVTVQSVEGEGSTFTLILPGLDRNHSVSVTDPVLRDPGRA